MSGFVLREFERVAATRAETTAIVAGGRETTYGELRRFVGTWERELARRDVAGSRCVLAVPGGVEHTALCLALWRRGAVPVPLDPATPPGELTEFQDAVEASLLVTPGPTGWTVTRLESAHRPVAGESLLFASSGTTGRAKFVSFDGDAIGANIADQVRAFGLGPEDTVAAMVVPTTPGFLTTALWPALVTGAAVHVLPVTAPSRVLRALRAARPTVVYGVPLVFRALADIVAARGENAALAHDVRLCLSSSAHLTGDTFDAFERSFGLWIRSIYCSVEGGSCTFNNAADRSLVRDSVGVPLPGVRVRVVDPTGAPCAVGEEGEVMVAGTHLASGYAGPGTRSAFRDGWVATGDLGALDASGHLFIRGRLSDTINVAGHLVNPQHVEWTLLSHPAVAEALVYADQHTRRGEVLAADVVLRADTSTAPTARELTRFCAERSDHYSWVHRIRFVADLPRGRDGKVRRFAG